MSIYLCSCLYVNGSHNLPNLKLDDENWMVRLIEEDFMKRVWDVDGVKNELLSG